jgi:hypothetical protein
MLIQILTAWRLVAPMESCEYRNAVFWRCVEDIRNTDFIGDPRRVLERAARWAR